MTKQELLIEISKTPYFEVVFTKKNGEKRILHGCLDGELISKEDAIPKNSSSYNEDNGMIKVYDFVNHGWRTIIVSSIEAIKFAKNLEALDTTA